MAETSEEQIPVSSRSPSSVSIRLEPPTSPSSVSIRPKPPTMDFPNAIREVMRGARITSLEWGDTDTYVHLSDGRLKIHKSEDGKNYDLIVSDGDLFGTDWQIL